MFVASPALEVHQAAFGNLGAPEVIIIILVVLLLFGGKKLPEIARGSGRALRIFKAETKGLMDKDDEDEAADKPASASPPAQIEPPPPADPAAPVEQPRSETEH